MDTSLYDDLRKMGVDMEALMKVRPTESQLADLKNGILRLWEEEEARKSLHANRDVKGKVISPVNDHDKKRFGK